jgi:ATP-binding cassette subfamily B protein RaxB
MSPTSASFRATERVIDKAFELKLLRLHVERLADIVLTNPEVRRGVAGRLLWGEGGRLDSTVELRDVCFRYAEHEPFVLDGVNLSVCAGESVAVVGPSGCGKSTLIHVMLGVLTPTSGDVWIGGLRLEAIDPDALRRTVASVTQSDTLFAGSIADNISFFDAQGDQAWIEECARIAAIHAEIVALPMGYNTFVGYSGSMLSAGRSSAFSEGPVCAPFNSRARRSDEPPRRKARNHRELRDTRTKHYSRDRRT